MASITKRRNGDGSTSWDAQVYVTGFPRSTKSFRTKLAAELWAARTETLRKGGSASGIPARMTFAMLLDEIQPTLKNPTKAIFDHWREAFGTMRAEKVSARMIDTHIQRLLGAECHGYRHKTVKPRSAATVRNYAIELGRLMEKAVKLGYLESNPCRKVEKPSVDNAIVRYLSDDEREALLKACKESESPDLYPFVLFCLTTGCRKGEAEALLWANVDIPRRWATFPRTKNGSARGVPLTTAVAALLETRERTGLRVFPVDITKAWHGAVARAGIQNFRFHDLRHSCGSAMVQNGANLAEVATLLGHKSLQMTLRYSHVGNAGTTSLVDRVMGGIA